MPKPAEEDLTLRFWKSKNSLMVGWLINSMKPEIEKRERSLDAVKYTDSNIRNLCHVYGLKYHTV